MGYVSRSGLAMLGWLPNIVLVPVITFYLLRDWDHFMAAIRDMFPRAATRVLDHRLAGDKVMRTKVL